MSVAPGAPIVMRGGRSVMADDAAAARERRLNRKVRRDKPWPPRPVAAVTLAAPVAAPAPVADAASGSATQAAGGAQVPAASPKASAPAKVAPKAAPKKKTPEPLGW